jgi:ribose/xylose/arabinose/galactoside ABC-type transport system permease subunit
MALYATSGAVSALAGILGAARLSTASPSAGGASLTFQVVTAVIIGGTSLFGGTGTIAGSALGAILFAEINNGLQVINVDPAPAKPMRPTPAGSPRQASAPRSPTSGTRTSPPRPDRCR